MKFCKTYVSYVEELSPVLPALPYKKLKRDIRLGRISRHAFIRALRKHCNRIDSFFRAQLDAMERGRDLPLSCCCGHHRLSPISLESYADMNNKAVFKICKKFCKHNTRESSVIQDIRDHRYGFMSNTPERTWLRFVNGSLDISCCICLSEDGHSYHTTSCCGKLVCWDCVRVMTGYDRFRGTHWNKLTYGSSLTSCPLCRRWNPFGVTSKFSQIDSSQSQHSMSLHTLSTPHMESVSMQASDPSTITYGS